MAHFCHASIENFNSVKANLLNCSENTEFYDCENRSDIGKDEITMRLKNTREQNMLYIIACWEECGSEDNPVTRHERYKKYMGKYDRETVVDAL